MLRLHCAYTSLTTCSDSKCQNLNFYVANPIVVLYNYSINSCHCVVNLQNEY